MILKKYQTYLGKLFVDKFIKISLIFFLRCNYNKLFRRN